MCYLHCMRKQTPDLSGQKFNMLTVLSFQGYHPSHRFNLWLCRCDCGREKIIPGFCLLRGSPRSCGCLKESKQKPGMGGARKLFGGYRRDAARRNLVFNLTLDQFLILTSTTCYYCGVPPSTLYKYHGGGLTPKGIAYGSYMHNGIDRKDSTKGYFTENVVPCCWDCNVAKHAKTLEEFQAWIARLIEYQTNLQRHSSDGETSVPDHEGDVEIPARSDDPVAS